MTDRISAKYESTNSISIFIAYIVSKIIMISTCIKIFDFN